MLPTVEALSEHKTKKTQTGFGDPSTHPPIINELPDHCPGFQLHRHGQLCRPEQIYVCVCYIYTHAYSQSSIIIELPDHCQAFQLHRRGHIRRPAEVYVMCIILLLLLLYIYTHIRVCIYIK